MLAGEKFRFVEIPLYGRISYSLFGKGKRKAFFFHGYPGSRHQAGFIAPHLEKNNFEVCSFDRPGFGHSTFFKLPGAPLDHSKILAALADSFGWEKFHLLAVSGGAPYALRSAAELKKRVESVQVVCGLGPLHETEFRQHFSPLLIHGMRIGSKIPARFLNAAMPLIKWNAPSSGSRRPSFLSPADFELLRSEAVRPKLNTSLSAAFRQGVRGAQRDLEAFLSDWDLDYSSLKMPLNFWHGRDDRLIPALFSEIMASRFKNAQFLPVEEEGHYTLPIRRAEEILRKIP